MSQKRSTVQKRDSKSAIVSRRRLIRLPLAGSISVVTVGVEPRTGLAVMKARHETIKNDPR